MTTLWVKLEALSPECKYTKAKENKISITINNNMEVKKEKHVVHQGKSTAVNRNVNPSPTESRPRPGCHNLRKRERERSYFPEAYLTESHFSKALSPKNLYDHIIRAFKSLQPKSSNQKNCDKQKALFFGYLHKTSILSGIFHTQVIPHKLRLDSHILRLASGWSHTI